MRGRSGNRGKGSGEGSIQEDGGRVRDGVLRVEGMRRERRGGSVDVPFDLLRIGIAVGGRKLRGRGCGGSAGERRGRREGGGGEKGSGKGKGRGGRRGIGMRWFSDRRRSERGVEERSHLGRGRERRLGEGS